MKDYNFYIYILTNNYKNVLYIGVTNNLKRRLLDTCYIEYTYATRKGIEKE